MSRLFGDHALFLHAAGEIDSGGVEKACEDIDNVARYHNGDKHTGIVHAIKGDGGKDNGVDELGYQR